MDLFAKIKFNNIQRIQFDKFEKDFYFIVNGKIYKTNFIVANILSPILSKNFDENMNLSYYEINTKYEGDFKRIIKYGEMKSMRIKKEETQYFLNILKILGNKDDFLQFSQEFQGDISYENVIQRIQTKKELDIHPDEEIAFISTNFHYFKTNYSEFISALGIDIIEQIISNDNFKVNSEDELFDFILDLYTTSKEYSILFSYLIFLNLSPQSIQEFNKIFDVNDINNSIWKNICYRLEQDISNRSKEMFQKSHKEFLTNRYIFQNNMQRHEHIIQYLNEQCHGNVHTQNIVCITSSTIGFGKVENIVVHDDSIYFGTENAENSWIQFDFKESKVLLDSYTLKTLDWKEDSAHLKNWVLEVSNDGQNYTEVDRQENCDLLNGKLKKAKFQVSFSIPQRFVRLRQIGTNWGQNYYIRINQIEFSGFLLK